MNTTVKNILMAWHKSLIKNGTVRTKRFEKDVEYLHAYTMSKLDTHKQREQVALILDVAQQSKIEFGHMLLLLYKLKRQVEKSSQKRCKIYSQDQSISARYKYTVQRVYQEKIKFDGMQGLFLKNVDVTLEDPKYARKIRKIVDKRMGQECYKMNNGYKLNTNHLRHNMRQATSYMLDSMGVIENIIEDGITRDESTHWKRTIDPYTQMPVLKKKLCFNTEKEAILAAGQRALTHPFETPMTAYKCASCGKWHIGHNCLTIEEGLSKITQIS